LASIDICIPYWGEPALMRETVESVLAQDSDRWFLTVLDDAYRDPAIGEWMATLNHPRVRYMRNDTNLGIVGNYRKLLGMATRELVMLLGCDDVLHPNYVSTMLQAYERFPAATVFHPATRVIDENGDVVRTLPDWAKTRLVMPAAHQLQVLEGEPLAVSLLAGDWLYWPAITFQTERIKGFDFNADLKITHDLAFVMDLIFAGQQLLQVPTVCFSYRRHSKSASTSSLFDGRRFAEERRYFAMATDLAAKKGWKRAERSARWHLTSRANALWIAANAVVKGKWDVLPDLLKHVFNRAD
jgi:GT2 family glycosyltransferase